MKTCLKVLFVMLMYPVFAQTPSVSGGSISHYPNFPSNHVTARNIDVWIPQTQDSSEPYSVLYMHDGQMLFDSTFTWNKQEWGVDETLTQLITQNSIHNTIVVGIWNTPQRRRDYFPEKVFYDIRLPLRDSIEKDISGRPQSDAYLRFIVEELKPFIDSVYKPYTDRQHTYIAGSSMGGLISFYALCEYPNVFGGAACLSSHWPGSVYRNTQEVPEAFARYAHQYLPRQSLKIYIDQGTEGLDSWYAYGNKLMNKEIRKRGYTIKMLSFNGANHSEKAWKNRLSIPLVFLLHK